MKRNTKVVLGVGGLIVVAAMGIPAAAATNGPNGSPGSGNPARNGDGQAAGNCDGTGGGARARDGSGNGTGRRAGGGMGFGARGGAIGSGVNLTGVASGSLTDSQRTALAGMAEEEKLAHDLYVALGAKYPDLRQFQNIPAAETRHLAAVRTLMTRYSIADPTAGKAAGEFSTPAVRALYDKLLARGVQSPAAALKAGATVEKMDIADLRAAGKSVTAPDVIVVYSRLTQGSQHHLAAFRR